MQYAYIRVSSADQNTARQEEALSKAGFQPDKICVEHASAKDTNRPGLQELLGQLRPGDTLLVHSIDRLCRNMSDMCAVTTRLRDQGVTLIFLKEQLTFSAGTNNPMQELQLHRHCCKVSDEAAFCLIQRPYISKTLLTRRISPRGSP
ncbi:recombinase family protein [Klebsiella pneumoniae]